MKVLFNSHTPFSFAHGGEQIQMERTRAALEKIGVETQSLQWWNEEQTGDILHHFGWLHPTIISLAQSKGLRVFITALFSEQSNRPAWQLFPRQLAARSLLGLPMPLVFRNRLPWQPYRVCDRMIVGLNAEAAIVQKLYGVPRSRIAVVPLGLSDAFLQAGTGSRTGHYLISPGTITPVKNSIGLAQLATQAKVPVLFVGKPYSPSDPYWRAFEELIDQKWVQYHPHASEREMIDLLRQARGFVLMSRYENWSLVAHEAAACGLPLLLPNQRWAHELFGPAVRYFPKDIDHGGVEALAQFYAQASHLPPPAIKLFSWLEVAQQLKDAYSKALSEN